MSDKHRAHQNAIAHTLLGSIILLFAVEGANHLHGAADLLGQPLLRQVERGVQALDPGAER